MFDKCTKSEMEEDIRKELKEIREEFKKLRQECKKDIADNKQNIAYNRQEIHDIKTRHIPPNIRSK